MARKANSKNATAATSSATVRIVPVIMLKELNIVQIASVPLL
ncbi:MAG: hypothetical protein O3A92_16320 [Verrucomicrobia bacterium]|nr:hypothetical protein [Verrucomicrobiota bacterium]